MSSVSYSRDLLGIRIHCKPCEDTDSWVRPHNWLSLQKGLEGFLFDCFFSASLRWCWICSSTEAQFGYQGPTVGFDETALKKEKKSSFIPCDGEMQWQIYRQYCRNIGEGTNSSYTGNLQQGGGMCLGLEEWRDSWAERRGAGIPEDGVAWTTCRMHLRIGEELSMNRAGGGRGSITNGIKKMGCSEAGVWKSMWRPSKMLGTLFCRGEQWSF